MTVPIAQGTRRRRRERNCHGSLASIVQSQERLDSESRPPHHLRLDDDRGTAWGEVGIKIAINASERSLFVTATRANEHDIGIWGMDRHAPVIADMYWLVPRSPGYGIWANEYAKWYGSGGTSGEEPTGDLRRVYDLWDTVKITVDPDERDRLMNEIIALHAKNIWLVGTVGENPSLVIAKNNFRNVPERLVSDNGLMTPGNAEPEQFFIRQ